MAVKKVNATTEEKVEAESTKPVKKVSKRTPTAEPKTTVKKIKKEPKVAEPKKVVTEARASVKNCRVTPRKVRLVLDLVRGKDVKEALGILKNVNKSASEPVSKLIKSASANATNNFGMDMERLYIAEISAGDGIKMKRYLPRAKGGASGLVKRSSHINVVLKMR